MRSLRLYAVLLSAVLVAPGALSPARRAAAQSAPDSAKPPKAAGAAPPANLYRDEPLVFEHFDTTVRMHADGTGERLQHVVVRVQSEGAARQLGVLAVGYASAVETGTIDFARVHKADGSTIETPVSELIETPAPVSREAPLYSDLKEKQLPVRALTAGDTLEYQLHTVRTRAEAPGQFWGAEHFTAAGIVVLSETLTLEAPAATYVKVWSPNHAATPAVREALRTWHWSASQTKPSSRDNDGKMVPADVHDPDQDTDGRNLPSVAWTTFHSWDEVGAWYRGLALARTEPDDAVRSKAAELTRAATSPEEQVRALYRYVSTQVRYVGIDFGIGRYQPHAAHDVLSTQYGDCKDKDTLLEALLRAKGFSTAPALIGVNIAPVPDVPSPAVFNHVITTVELNGGRVWLDATPEVQPFRVLSPAIRDHQALLIPATATARLERTPADPPFAYFERFEATATLDKDGLLKSRMAMTVRSDNEAGYRVLLQRAAPAQWDGALEYVSGAMGFSGKVTHADLRQSDSAGPVHFTYDYSREDFADWKNGRILPLFPALEVAVLSKEKGPEHDIDQGAPRTLEAHTRLRLPEGYRADLPDAVHVRRSYATFDQTYRLEKGELLVDRKVVILTKKIAKGEWKDYLAFSKAAGFDEGEHYIPLIAPLIPVTLPVKVEPSGIKKSEATAAGGGKDTETRTIAVGSGGAGTSTTKSAAGAPVASEGSKVEGASALELIEQARQAETAGDLETARSRLGQAKALDPHAPYVMSMLGYLALRDHKMEEAYADVKQELADHPDADTSIVLMLVAMHASDKQYSEALALLQRYGSRDDVRLSLALADVQGRMNDPAAAAATLRTASLAHPDDRTVTNALPMALLRAHRNTEAAAAAEAAMDGSDDPGLLNDSSYVLSQLGTDLPLAEQKARQAVELLEAKSAQRSVTEANSTAFAEANLLAAAWDTLGWILFQESKAAAAEPYLAAAWFNKQNVTIGGHLARAREALGKPSEALTLDELAVATEHAADEADEYAEAQRNIERLQQSGARSSAGDTRNTLQEMRMFHVGRPTGVKGWGVFRVQLSGSGVHDSDLVSRPPAMRPMTAELKKLTIPNALPPGSPALLLRDAVVSCSSEKPQCDFVLMPHAGLGAETAP